MSPIHLFVWSAALCFQLINASCIGGWLAGYGPTTAKDWEGHTLWIQIGVVVFLIGYIGNIIHDDELRSIRRTAAARQAARQAKEGKSDGTKVDKVYEVPSNGLFEYILYPHYFCEWIEWAGYWMIGGWNCVPARNFLLNEIFSMFPRAIQGRRWYIERFGEEKINGRKAIIPGVI
jgi:3-oxo-5-alpha-steroid 4-dehydrogenase 1